LERVLTICGDVKDIGNKLYKEKDYMKAKNKYKKALR